MKHTSISKPIIIAGPCLAESFALLDEVAGTLVPLAEELGFELFFKASFDKANRSSIENPRGPGLEQGLAWLAQIKKKYACKIITDVHETWQVEKIAEVCDGIQIPAFLCRQTDLLLAAAKSGCFVNLKKGQFMSPDAMQHLVQKVDKSMLESGRLFLCERGSSFGYGDLVVDMRGLKTMAASQVPIIFDVTHSTQKPPAGNKDTSGALRSTAPLLARAATATGYLDGYFLEIHSNPAKALSDAQAQLSISQGVALLKQLVPMWHTAKEWKQIDPEFV